MASATIAIAAVSAALITATTPDLRTGETRYLTRCAARGRICGAAIWGAATLVLADVDAPASTAAIYALITCTAWTVGTPARPRTPGEHPMLTAALTAIAALVLISGGVAVDQVLKHRAGEAEFADADADFNDTQHLRMQELTQ